MYANKLDNLEEMDTLLQSYNLSRLNQDEIKNMKRPVTSKEIEIVTKKNKNSGPHSFTGNYTKH